jgi:hypothetical protein
LSSNEPFALNEYQSFELLVEDLHAVFENVAPVAAHDGVYSHRIYEILLRACTEFESVCKELLEKQGEIVARPTMGNYLPVLGKYVQPELQVGLFFWSPKLDF